MKTECIRIHNELRAILPPEVSGKDFLDIKEAGAEPGITRIKVDLHNCVYIQSKVLADLIGLKKHFGAKKVEVVLTNVNEGVFQLLEMSNILSFFPIEDDFSSFGIDDLLEFFHDQEMADRVSDFIASNYTDEYRSRFIELLANGDPIMREYAILTIGKSHDHDMLETIRTFLKSESPNVIRAALLVLGWLGDMESKENIYPFLNSPSMDVAEAAAASIALLSDDSDAPKLKELLKSSDHRIRKIAIQALSLINDDASYDVLKECVAHEGDESVRVVLAKRLSLYNRDEVADILITLLDDRSLVVREAAASGLIRISPKQKLPEILKKVTDPDNWVGYFATKALATICDSSCASHLISAFPQVEQNVRLAIIESIGKIPHDSSDFLFALMDDANEDTRKEALNALTVQNSAKALEAAKKVFAGDPSWLVRFKAVEIIAQMKPEGYVELLRAQLDMEMNKYVRDKLLFLLGDK